MNAYLIPIETALIFFPFIAAIMSIPYAIHDYRKYGKVHKLKTFLFFSFVFYMMTAFFLTLLPLPVVDKPRIPSGHYVQLIPFNFVHDIIKNTNVVLSDPRTYLHLFSESAFIQALFNAILLLPLGVYLRYYFKRNLKQTIFITFLVSLFFEVTQLTGIYGIYKYPYRLFDVDDLILNTFSGFLGYLITPMFTYILPDINKVKAKIISEGKYSTYPKRIIAFLIDWCICSVFLMFGGIIVFIVVTFIYFILIPYFTNGFTVGKKLLKMRLKGPNDRLTFIQLLKRYGVLIYGYFLTSDILNSASTYLSNIEKYDFLILITILQLALNLYVFIHIISHMIKHDPILLHDKISGVSNIDL